MQARYRCAMGTESSSMANQADKDSSDSQYYETLPNKIREAYEKAARDLNRVPHIHSQQLRVLQSCWQCTVSDIDYDFGLALFRYMLPKSTRIQQVFNVNMQEFDNLDRNGRLLSHAAVVKTALQTIIERFVSRLQGRNEFNSDSAIVRHIRLLGERHATVRPQGFTPDMWFPFAEALVSLIDTWPVPVFHRGAIKKVWLELVCFIIVNMRYGYNHVNLERNASKVLLCENQAEIKSPNARRSSSFSARRHSICNGETV